MWAQIISALLGIWLMAAPTILGIEGTAADNHFIVGPLVATLAIIAIFESTRGLRKGNIALGAWLLVSPWLIGSEPLTAIIADMVTGALIVGFSMVKGELKEKVGGGWQALWQSSKS